MISFKSSNIQQRRKWKFKMNFVDSFLNWYQRYFTEITWFLIGDLTISTFQHLETRSYVNALWCAVLAAANYFIWKRSR